MLKEFGKVEIRAFIKNRKLVEHLQDCSTTDTDEYYIFLDYVPDNLCVLNLVHQAQKYVTERRNMHLMPLLCFEYLLLQSDYVCKMMESYRSNKGYSMAMVTRSLFLKHISLSPNVSVMQNAELSDLLRGYYSVCNLTTEGVATLLLHNLTNSTPMHYKLVKTEWEECWTCNCCKLKYGSKICKQYSYMRTAQDKAKALYEKTAAKKLLEMK